MSNVISAPSFIGKTCKAGKKLQLFQAYNEGKTYEAQDRGPYLYMNMNWKMLFS